MQRIVGGAEAGEPLRAGQPRAPQKEIDIERLESSLSYWALIRYKFLQNKLAVLGLVLIGLFFLLVLPAEFTAPYKLTKRHRRHIAAPPQMIHFFDSEGRFHLRPFVYGLKEVRNPVTLRITYKSDPEQMFLLGLFVRGEEYKLLFFRSNIHLFGVQHGYFFLLGTDLQGKDMWSRIIYGGRISLTVGLVGVLISLVLGTLIGIVSGYLGGSVDDLIQRAIEILMSFPSIPLWMALSAAVPDTWNPIQVFFMITIILSIVGWGGLARVVRGMTLSLKNEDFIPAARINGADLWWIVTRHLLPGNISYLIVSATLAIPGMILGETALSFLGLGIRPPMTSWGVLLQQAQDVTVLAHQPWLTSPVIMVIISVLCFNFIGDGMRDAADPFSSR